MATRTISLLPAIFRTDANRKFLNATLDQLLTDPKFKNINGYIGRKTTLAYKNTDSYVLESTVDGQNYQFEPSLYVADEETPITANYLDLLSAMQFYGGTAVDHNRLFDCEQYSYDGFFDYDKFINYNQYYWLPNGPDSVLITSSAVNTPSELDVTRNDLDKVYTVTGFTQKNPVIVLARNKTYTFNVEQPGFPFYIQAQPGIDGVYSWQKNISSREVYGVTDNGNDVGTVTFDVPALNAQDWILTMPLHDNVDYATNYSYRDLANKSLEYIQDILGGPDGVTDVVNKTVVFTNYNATDEDWTADGIYDDYLNPYGGSGGFDGGEAIAEADRPSVFLMQVDNNYAFPIVKFSRLALVPEDYKVRINGGVQYGYREFYRPLGTNVLELLPIATARMDTLYYQDGVSNEIVGVIRLIDSSNDITVNVEIDILGKKNYVSLNNVTFTNGLKVKFDNSVEPVSYQSNEYYVEGVGDAIRLVPVTELITPENYVKEQIEPWDTVPWGAGPWDPTTGGPTVLDYITINRASRDRNQWSRSNRWFHIDVITATADYNKYPIELDLDNKAKRPIIEFIYDLHLFNFGTNYNSPVDLIDFVTTDAFSNVEGSITYDIDGIELTNGLTVIFAADTDDDVRNKIYKVNIVDPSGDGSSIKHLTLVENATVEENQIVLIERGILGQGLTYHLLNNTWILSQQKTVINQEPLFDIFDSDQISLADTNKYPSSTFAGTTIFSYKKGTGVVDLNLGFPLAYRNFTNLGDVLFTDNFNLDTFSYVSGEDTITPNIRIGKIHKYTTDLDFTSETAYIKKFEHAKQYQVFQFIVESNNTEKQFRIDSAGITSAYIQNLLVYLNNKFLNSSSWQVSTINGHVYITIPSAQTDDKIDMYIYDTTKILNSSFYQVPSNLENNSDNQISEEYTLGQLRNHVVKVFEYNKEVSGVMPGSNNLRDLLLIKDTGGTILQHSGSINPAMLFMCHPELNFIEAIQYAAREYAKIKNKILDFAVTVDDSLTQDIPRLLDVILAEVNGVKNKDFPWYYSDMVPYGEDKISNNSSLIIDDDNRTIYNLFDAFDLSEPSRNAVLVYLNKVLLIHGQDYTFTENKLGVKFTDTLEVNINDTLDIVEYLTTNGSWIPETPTKLGLYPKFAPEKYLDNTFANPINIIRGHDGSITPAFNDYRDDLLLEFERRIYNNIKVEVDSHKVSIYDVKPGAFRDTKFQYEEYVQILGKFFSRWAGIHKLDFTDTTGYQSNNAFTWNYKKHTDRIFEKSLQGSWRSIFEHFYDTIRPHTHPWEMLGFSEKPDYWENRYGVAPYSGGNLVLWQDLRDGLIFDGPRQGIDERFARPNLIDIIPTDQYGDLRTPVEIFVKSFDSRKTDYSYAVGEIGPTEAAWYRSSDYPFALQQVLAVTKPARFFGELIDNHNYVYDTLVQEFTFAGEKRRIQINDWLINGNEDISYASYSNYVADRLSSLGIDPISKLTEVYNNTSIRLSYNLSGYSDLNKVKILAEQASPTSASRSIIVPDENINLIIKKFVPSGKIVYSGVIVEKTGTGFKITGYDKNNSFFPIIPSVANSNKNIITVLGTEVAVYQDYELIKVNIPYGAVFASKQQVVDFLVSYQRYLISQGITFDELDTDLGENRSFILSSKEFLLWADQTWGDNTVIVLNPLSNRLRIQTPGLIVDEINSTLAGTSRVSDTNFNFLKNNQFNVVRIGNDFTINAIDTSFALVDLTLVKYDHCAVLDNTTIFNDVIYEPSTGNRQQRVKLVGYKTLDYDGSISAPGYYYNSPFISEWDAGNDYKKGTMIRFKNQLYSASLDIPSAEVFEYEKWKLLDNTKIKAGLLPSFGSLAKQGENYYDISNFNNTNDINVSSKGLIGWRNREHFSDLGIDDVSQAKFYQGFIKEKGSKSSIDALLGAQFDSFSTDVNYYENWALRAGEFGAIDINQYIEIILPENEFASNPKFGEFALDGAVEETGRYYYTPNGSGSHKIRILPKPYSENLFISSKNKVDFEKEIRSAGYLKLADVDGTIYNLTNPNFDNKQTFIDRIGSGFKLWVAKKQNANWDLYRAEQVAGTVTEVTNGLDSRLDVQMSQPHNLSIGDYIVLKNFDTTFDNIYRISSISSVTSFLVDIIDETVDLEGFESTIGNGIIYKFTSVRFNTVADWASYTPQEGYKANDVVAIDQWGPDYVDWAVFKKKDLYTLNDRINFPGAVGNENFGNAVAFLDAGQILIAGVKGSGTGKIVSYRNYSDDSSIVDISSNTDFYEYNETETLTATNLDDFGHAISAATNEWFAVGAPASDSDKGYVFIYRRTNEFNDGSTVYLELSQAFSIAGAATKFGSSLAMSADGRWLYVGAPIDASGKGKVFVYAFEDIGISTSNVIVGDGSTVTFATGLTLADDHQLLVTDTTTKTYVLNKDYTVSGNDITFIVAPINTLNITLIAPGQYFTDVGTTLVAADGVAGDNFGHSISTTSDGAQVIIGAPYHDTGGTDNGAAYVFDRTRSSVISDGSSLQYIFPRVITSKGRRTTVDDINVTDVTYATGGGVTQVTFSIEPEAGSIITVDTNTFQLAHKLQDAIAEAEQNYGFSVAVCPTNCAVYVGAPDKKDGTQFDLKIGSVYRYLNYGRTYGSLTGTVTNPTVTVGHSIRINDFEVEFTGTSLASVVTDITNVGIPGITAQIVANKLQIDADSLVVNEKLRILPGVGTGFTDLGFIIYSVIQRIDNPNPEANTQFGKALAVHNTANRLYVGSDQGTGVQFTTFDNKLTTFDLNSIVFKDEVTQSGFVVVYEYIGDRVNTSTSPGSFIFTQYLMPGSLTFQDQFGISIAAYGDYCAVGSPGSDFFGTDFGSVFAFKASDTQSWIVNGTPVSKVDVTAINRFYIYNSRVRDKLIDLDFIDPAKGKIAGDALQNIDYLSEHDPAGYGDNFTSLKNVWGIVQVGDIWWNLDAVRYLEYEQGDFEFRSTHWGSVFPGSVIQICEWVQSSVLPSEYVASGAEGVPVFDDTHIVTETNIDVVTNKEIVKYYYWVANGAAITTNNPKNKTLTPLNISNLILDPKGQGVGYAVAISPNQFGVFNVNDFLTDEEAILHIDYEVEKNDRVIHAEYDLIQEYSPYSVPSQSIIDKFIVSLAGLDYGNNVVPDPTLDEHLKYGILIRPRQSVFNSKNEALQKSLGYLNALFAKFDLIELLDLELFNITDPIPSKNSGKWDITVEDLTELSYLNLEHYSVGTKVLILVDSDYNNGWTIYQLQANDTWLFVEKEVYSLRNYWSYVDYVSPTYDITTVPDYVVDTKNDVNKLTLAHNNIIKITNDGTGRFKIIRYDSTNPAVFITEAHQSATIKYKDSYITDANSLAIETRELFTTLFNDILVNDLLVNANELIFILIRHILHEQKNVDWLFKTSFIDIIHNFRKLEQNTVYIKDNHDFLVDYVTEAKPYHTKIREYKFNYTGLDPWNGDVTDFDLPAYYDEKLGLFRSPNGDLTTDTNLLATDLRYRMWSENYKFAVESIIVEDVGAGYSIPPTIEISGGGGEGAEAYAVIVGGKIREIIVTDSGSGYTTTPTVTIIDIGPVTRSGLAYAQLNNSFLRKLKTVIRFDRYTYDTAVLTWAPNTSYNTGDYVVYNNVLYYVDPSDISSTTFVSGTTFDSDNLIEVINQDLAARNNPAAWAPNTSYVLNDYITRNGKTYRVINHFTSGTTFSSTNLLEVTPIETVDFGSANDRIRAYYNPISGQPGNDLDLLQTGITYPGVIVTGEHWPPNDGSSVAAYQNDTNLESYFTDVDLGTRPEDILVDGSAFVDTYSSHAPEEMIPGRIFDAVDIQVYTSPRTNLTEEGSGISNNIQYYVGTGGETSFSFKVAGQLDNVVTVYSRTKGRQRPGIDYNLDYDTYDIIFNTAPLDGELIYVLTQTHGGNYLLYDKTYTGDGTSLDYIIPTSFPTVNDLLIFVDGVRFFNTTDYVTFDSNGLVNLRFNSAPAVGTLIHIFVYSEEGYARELHTQIYTIPTPLSIYDPVDRNIPLDRSISVAGPWHAQMEIFVLNKRLRPPNNQYYIAAPTTVYVIPVSADVDGATIPDGDIEVYVNGDRMVNTIDYTLSVIDGSTLRTATFVGGREPTDDDIVVLSVLTNAEFSVVDSTNLVINDSVIIAGGDYIDIVTYSNHDAAKIRTKVYSGLAATALSVTPAFDSGPFDGPEGYDGTTTVNVVVPKISLEYEHGTSNNVFVYKNGILQFAGSDYFLVDAGTAILFNNTVIVLDTDIITITEFTESIQTGMMGFRIFKNLIDQTNYYRISFENSTKLDTDLGILDTEICVVDASILSAPNPISNAPGFVFINGERIGYWERDLTENKLKRLFRASGGTGAPLTHPAGEQVVSAGEDQAVPVEYDSDIVIRWAPGKAVLTDNYVLYEGLIYQATTGFTLPNEFTTTNLILRAQFRDKTWYEIIPGGQLDVTSTLVVLTNGEGLQDTNTGQANFVRAKTAILPL